MPVFRFEIAELYTRDQIAEKIGLPPERRRGGNWSTGYDTWQDEHFIFCNVGIAGRTGHDYPNEWLDKSLIWSGKTSSRQEQPLIRRMISGAEPVHVFWRGRDRSPFTYAGTATADEVRGGSPVQVVWTFDDRARIPNVESAPGSELRFYRGPVPTFGTRLVNLSDSEACAYIMVLTGEVRAVFPGLPGDLRIIKVGRANNLTRRLKELNIGFPPGSALSWRLEHAVPHASMEEAHAHESAWLERLREQRLWIGGEFAKLDSAQLDGLKSYICR